MAQQTLLSLIQRVRLQKLETLIQNSGRLNEDFKKYLASVKKNCEECKVIRVRMGYQSWRKKNKENRVGRVVCRKRIKC